MSYRGKTRLGQDGVRDGEATGVPNHQARLGFSSSSVASGQSLGERPVRGAHRPIGDGPRLSNVGLTVPDGMTTMARGASRMDSPLF